MLDGELEFLLLGQGLALEPLAQDGLDALVATGAERERPSAGGLQALLPEALAQAQDPETGGLKGPGSNFLLVRLSSQCFGADEPLSVSASALSSVGKRS